MGLAKYGRRGRGDPQRAQRKAVGMVVVDFVVGLLGMTFGSGMGYGLV